MRCSHLNRALCRTSKLGLIVKEEFDGMGKCAYIHKEILVGEESYDPEHDGSNTCQFEDLNGDVVEIDFYEVDGLHFCEFHCPLTDDKNNFTAKASWSKERKEEFSNKIKVIAQDDGKRVFHGHVDFSGTVFNVPLELDEREHSGYPNFSYCTFHEKVDLSYCHFKNDVDFRGAVFNEEVTFYQTRFDHGIDFMFCTFKENLILQFSLKSNFKDIEDRELIKSIDFRESKFFKQAKFDNRKFKGHSDFTECIFHKTPLFYGCELHQETDFPDFSNFKERSTESIKAYRVLKLAMENVRNRHDEGSFFALEQICLRKSKGVLGFFSMGFVYELASLYGLSLIRPMLWLSLFTLIFCFTYFSYFYMDMYYGLEAAEFTLMQIFKPFSVWGGKESELLSIMYNEVDLVMLKIVSSLQSIISISLIGVFLFALRWRFKRG